MPFIDHDLLPQPTTDLFVARRNLDEAGYCLLEQAIDPEHVRAVRARLLQQAAAEKELGVASFDAGPDGTGINQRLWFLVNKGQVFRDLLSNAVIRELVGHILGKHYLLSSMTANIARAGGIIGWHVDQWWFPPSVERNSDYVRPGSITREQFRDRNFYDDNFIPPPVIAPAVACNAMWMISDFTKDNGATLVVPGSHQWGRLPHASENPDIDVVPVIGPAGTVAVFEARLWHSTGASVSDCDRLGVLSYFCAPQFRQQENLQLGLDPRILETASEDLLTLLGYRPYQSYGRINGPDNKFNRPGERALGELRPGK